MADVLAEPLRIGSSELFASACIGIAAYPDDGPDPATLLKNADAAMHRAKKAGRNNHQFYTAAMNELALGKLQLESSLRHALARQEFVLHYQAKADLSTGAISGFEALIRWQHPDRGLVPPGEFIQALEDTGLIVAVGAWVLETVCRQIGAWQAAGITPVPVAINVSARQFQQQPLDNLIALIRDSRVDPGLLKIEITESLLMDDAEETVQRLFRLKAAGVKLSVDDFGTGYSSLAYLKRFPIDEIKIDRAFVSDIATDPDDAEIALAIIGLAHSLGHRVVAEGVETDAQLRFLRSHGCDEIQGYHFARPLPAAECTRLLAQKHCLQPSTQADPEDAPVLLLVDDTDNDRALIQKALAPSGYRILMADSPLAAFRLLADQPVNIIVSDHNMPGMTGVQFLARVRRIYPRAIRILATSVGNFDTMSEAINEAGIHKFLSKDWDHARLLAEILQAYRQHSRMAG